MTSNENDIEFLVIRELAKNGPLTVKDLVDRLTDEEKQISQRAIYRIIDRLEENHVVSKLKSFIILDAVYLSDQASLWQERYTDWLKHVSLTQLMGDTDINRWKFNDLNRLEAFWLQLMVTVMLTDDTKEMYNWTPHPWFHFCTSISEERYNKTLKTWNGKVHRVVGGNSPLDKEPMAYWQNTPGKTVFGHPNALPNNIYYNVTGDYIVAVKLGKVLTQQVDRLFNTLDKQPDYKLVKEIMATKEAITVEISSSKARAKALIAKIKPLCN